MKVLIVGAGIGGLAAATALAQAGHQVALVERAARFEPLGAGIVMAPNANRILAALGVDLAARATELPFLDLVGADGALLNRLDTSRYRGEFGPTLGMLRSGLHEALLAAVPDGVEMIYGTTVSDVVEHGPFVDVTLAPGGTTRRFDAVVGADGINSTVRALVHGPQELRYSGQTCWRGLAPNPGLTGAVEAWAGTTRIGAVPGPGGLLYYYLVMPAPRRAPQPSWPEGFHHAFRDHRGELGDFIRGLDQAPPLHHDLEELDAPRWGRSRVFLLGDAAHAMTPNQGQGAAMAIEDAVALGRALGDGPEGALRRYEAMRHSRVRAVQLASRRIGAAAHWRNPPARAIRNSLMRLMPAAAGDRQYRGIVEPGLALLKEAKAGSGPLDRTRPASP